MYLHHLAPSPNIFHEHDGRSGIYIYKIAIVSSYCVETIHFLACQALSQCMRMTMISMLPCFEIGIDTADRQAGWLAGW